MMIPDVLFDRNIAIHILATPEGIEKDVGKAKYDQPIAAHKADTIGEHVLEEGQNATTANKCHEDTACHGSIFTQSFGREVEDGTPHDRSAKTTERSESYLERHIGTMQVDGSGGRDEDEAE